MNYSSDQNMPPSIFNNNKLIKKLKIILIHYLIIFCILYPLSTYAQIKAGIENSLLLEYNSNIYDDKIKKEPDYSLRDKIEFYLYYNYNKLYIQNSLSASYNHFFKLKQLNKLMFEYSPSIFYLIDPDIAFGISFPFAIFNRINYYYRENEPESINFLNMNYKILDEKGISLYFNFKLTESININNEFNYTWSIYHMQKATGVWGVQTDFNNEADEYNYSIRLSYRSIILNSPFNPFIGFNFKYYLDTGGYYSFQGIMINPGFILELFSPLKFIYSYQYIDHDYLFREVNKRHDRIHWHRAGFKYKLFDNLSISLNGGYLYNRDTLLPVDKYIIDLKLKFYFNFIDKLESSSLIPDKGQDDVDDYIGGGVHKTRCDGNRCYIE